MKIYKICSQDEWQTATEQGTFTGSAVDVADGFIHFSAAHQVRETANRHYVGQVDLVLVEFVASELGNKLQWETSRGGDSFPHLYEHLPTDRATAVYPLPWNGHQHTFPDCIPD